MVVRSGYELVSAHPRESINDALEEMILDVVNRTLSFEALLDWFKARLRRTH
jgi:hypothetical protein